MPDYYDDYSIYGADPGSVDYYSGFDPYPYVPDQSQQWFDYADPWAGATWDMGVPPEFQWQDQLGLPEIQPTDFAPGFELQPWELPAWEGTQFLGGAPYAEPLGNALDLYRAGEREAYGAVPGAPTFAGMGVNAPTMPQTPTLPAAWQWAQPGVQTQPRDLFGIPGLTGNAVLTGALTAGQGLFSGLSSLLNKPKVDEELRAAQIDAIRAQAEAARAAANRPPPSGPGRSPEPFPPQRPGGTANLQEFLGKSGLLGKGKGGLMALYNQSLASQQQQIERAADKQRAQVIENANRQGINPANQLAEIDRKEQELLAALPASVNQSLAPLLNILGNIYGTPSPTGPSRY